jgi:hypothetical protein
MRGDMQYHTCIDQPADQYQEADNVNSERHGKFLFMRRALVSGSFSLSPVGGTPGPASPKPREEALEATDCGAAQAADPLADTPSSLNLFLL